MPAARRHCPTVDISPYLAERARAHNSAESAGVAAELDTACREVGFVQIVALAARVRVPQHEPPGGVREHDERLGPQGYSTDWPISRDSR